MLFEKENLIESEKEIKLQIYVEQLTNDLYRNKKIEVDSKKILELLSYLTSNENISTEMKTAIEYQNRKITDILHKKEVDQLKKYIKYLDQNSAEIKEKNTELAEKNAEIKKKDRINKLLIDFIYKMSIIRPGTIMYDLKEDGFDTSECGNCKDKSCKDCIKQYFERRSEE